MLVKRRWSTRLKLPINSNDKNIAKAIAHFRCFSNKSSKNLRKIDKTETISWEWEWELKTNKLNDSTEMIKWAVFICDCFFLLFVLLTYKLYWSWRAVRQLCKVSLSAKIQYIPVVLFFAVCLLSLKKGSAITETIREFHWETSESGLLANWSTYFTYYWAVQQFVKSARFFFKWKPNQDTSYSTQIWAQTMPGWVNKKPAYFKVIESKLIKSSNRSVIDALMFISFQGIANATDRWEKSEKCENLGNHLCGWQYRRGKWN